MIHYVATALQCGENLSAKPTPMKYATAETTLKTGSMRAYK